MAGFHVPDSEVRYPSLWFGPEDTADEISFVAIQEDNTLFLATLDWIKDVAREIRAGDRDPDQDWYELYARIPGWRGLHQCALGFAGSKDDLKLTVSIETGPVWACEL